MWCQNANYGNVKKLFNFFFVTDKFKKTNKKFGENSDKIFNYCLHLY